jgi:hypothetical protein
MRAYAVTTTGTDPRTAFAGSEVEARKIRMDWMSGLGLKRKDVEVKLIDIPTTKIELIGWLNLQMGKPE